MSVPAVSHAGWDDQGQQSADNDVRLDHGKRLISIDDVARIRRIESISVSPDGRRYAILVREADPVVNAYRALWYVGDVRGGQLTLVGSAGELRPQGVMQSLAAGESYWSPDGQWIAYVAENDNERQIWRSGVDGRVTQKITHNAADVTDFAWSKDGNSIVFRVAAPRLERQKIAERKHREGYIYDEDLFSFTDFALPPGVALSSWHAAQAPEESAFWVVSLDGGDESLANAQQRSLFDQERKRLTAGTETAKALLQDALVPPVVRANGDYAWMRRTVKSGFNSRLYFSDALGKGRSKSIACAATQCTGALKKIWWSADGKRIVFWRAEGINDAGQGFYAWIPKSNVVSTIVRLTDADVRQCKQAADDLIVCIRETLTLPPHVVSVDLRSGKVTEVANPNPQFQAIRLGAVERFEWETPKFDWNEAGGALEGLYPKRAFGYIFYPPNFDARKKYPVFVEPYVARGFEGSLGSEHALHVYAANGFIVLSTEFPRPNDVTGRLGASLMKTLYSQKLGYPHLSMLMESTVCALRAVEARGFIDLNRVGMGGVSHGSFVPLYMMQKHDLLAAISISSAGWGPQEYYSATKAGREFILTRNGSVGADEWMIKPEGEGRAFWNGIDIADHIDTIEAPILMNLAASEVYAQARFIRYLEDEGKPYDAYVFSNETHLKWMPAHLYAIMNRNLDWFRFWLQGIEDDDAQKMNQFARWRALKNKRMQRF